MTYTNALIVAGLLVCGLEACDATSLEPIPLPTASRAAAARPMTGRCETTYQIGDFVFLPPPNDTILVSLTASHTGTCSMTHLGDATVVKVETVTFDETGGHVRGAGVTFTAANGDQLRGVESADLTVPDGDGVFRFTGSWTFNGGTGRFANATGEVFWSGSGNIEAGTTERAFEGWISY